MSTTLTLDDIAAGVAARYAGLEVDLGNGEKAELRNPLRMGKGERAELAALTEKISSSEDGDKPELEEDEVVDTIKDAVAIMVGNPGPAGRLARLLGDDVASWIYLFETWGETVSPGEASPSQG